MKGRLTQLLPRVTDRPLDWRLASLVFTLGALVLADLYLLRSLALSWYPTDWLNYVEAGNRAWASEPIYAPAPGYAFPYSPLAAYAFGALAPLGHDGWAWLHVAAALLLPWPMGLFVLPLYPFWWDVATGNVIIFQLLAAAWALRGKNWAIGSYLITAVLIPRPLTLPLTFYLLWRHSAWRGPFAGILGLSLVGAAMTSQMDAWIAASARQSGDMTSIWNSAPSQLIGWFWIPIGLALATWLTFRGRVGLASLAASPYWLPYYLLFVLLDWQGLRTGHRTNFVPLQPHHESGAAVDRVRVEVSSADPR